MSPSREFQPSPAQQRLFPAVSGNALNGLRETTPRRPTPVYWHDPARLPHGALQVWMLERCRQDVPVVRDLQHTLGGRDPHPPDPAAPGPATDTPAGWTAWVKAFALAHEADLVGVARLDPLWVFEGYEVREPWVIVLGVAMDHARLATAPEPTSMIEVMTQYNRGTRAARALAASIRARGYAARPHGGPTAGPVTMIPAALACGFGELGKHGSIINRAHGSSFRLACVLTDLPLEADAPDALGADEFCHLCHLCTDACPPGAIVDVKQMVRGQAKWYVDFDRCLPYFNETYGCGICIAVCPWSRPAVAPRLADKLAARRGAGARAV